MCFPGGWVGQDAGCDLGDVGVVDQPDLSGVCNAGPGPSRPDLGGAGKKRRGEDSWPDRGVRDLGSRRGTVNVPVGPLIDAQ